MYWKGVDVFLPPSPACANFTLMIECTPESSRCHSVLCASPFFKWMYSVKVSLRTVKLFLAQHYREGGRVMGSLCISLEEVIWGNFKRPSVLCLTDCLPTINVHQCGYLFTAKTQYRKFETSIPRKGITWPQSKFPDSCVCVRYLYSHDRSVYSAAGKYVDQSWENKSLTDTWVWKLGMRPRASSFLGIYKWDFRWRVTVV